MDIVNAKINTLQLFVFELRVSFPFQWTLVSVPSWIEPLEEETHSLVLLTGEKSLCVRLSIFLS